MNKEELIEKIKDILLDDLTVSYGSIDSSSIGESAARIADLFQWDKERRQAESESGAACGKPSNSDIHIQCSSMRTGERVTVAGTVQVAHGIKKDVNLVISGNA